MNKFVLLISLLFGVSAFADLKEDFDAVNKNSKGPFSLNYLQGTQSRTTVKNGAYPSGGVIFQAAFRNDKARVLSENYDFYVGNLYTTNYYELIGQYVFNDAYGSHAVDHNGLYQNSLLAMSKAATMAKHWVLEKYYVKHFESTRISRSYRLRGISGAEFETEYAQYFFQFYLQFMNDDLQYLVAQMLIQDSPIADSSGLKKARYVIDEIYQRYASRYGADNSSVRRLWKIRNTIHNQVSPEAIAMIDKFLADNPSLKTDKSFSNVRANLKAYFSFSIENLIESATSLGLTNFVNLAKNAKASGESADSLLLLSRGLADLKTALVSEKSIAGDKMPAVLSLIAKSANYLNKELSDGSNVGSKTYIEAVANVIYAEGFLIADNWAYFISEIQNASSNDSAKSVLTEIIGIASETLNYAFEPALNQWIIAEPKMDNFKDNTLKASSLNAAAKNIN